ncbi:hypothetical protein [Vallicoccus soli]|uniref:Uncharacterized protein n=1 Tax=Vallicoccus soli TaxID=2339232 RepID=A0A3A3Z1D4_9ACTN|nr:hypothetical protein [Vallicoccus soli]RJK96317.1 hypothetical protein D5H78_08700 [Vallicoccus soli]
MVDDPATTSLLLRRRPPGAVPAGQPVVFTLEEVALQAGAPALASAVVVHEGPLALVLGLTLAPDQGCERAERLLRDVLDALRAEGCTTVGVVDPPDAWLPALRAGGLEEQAVPAARGTAGRRTFRITL